MPVIHSRKTAREKEAALTATITESRHARIASGTYTELDLQQAIGSTNVAALEAIVAERDATPGQVDETWRLRKVVRELSELAELPMSPRTNPRAQSMTRSGRRYAIRKDHGTKFFYAEIAKDNAMRGNRKRNSCSQRRKRDKLTMKSGNPAVIAKLVRNGDLLVG